MKEKINEREVANSIHEHGYGIAKGICDDSWDEEGYVPDKWYVFRVWIETGCQKLTMYYDWKHGDAYFFIKGKMSAEEISNTLKLSSYDVCDVEKYLKKEFPYLNTAIKVAERIEKNGLIACMKSKKVLEYTSEYNDEFMSVVRSFLPYDEIDGLFYYLDEENSRVIVGDMEKFKEWFKKHEYPFRKPCYIEDDEECEEWEMEPDVDFRFI